MPEIANKIENGNQKGNLMPEIAQKIENGNQKGNLMPEIAQKIKNGNQKGNLMPETPKSKDMMRFNRRSSGGRAPYACLTAIRKHEILYIVSIFHQKNHSFCPPSLKLVTLSLPYCDL